MNKKAKILLMFGLMLSLFIIGGYESAYTTNVFENVIVVGDKEEPEDPRTYKEMEKTDVVRTVISSSTNGNHEELELVVNGDKIDDPMRFEVEPGIHEYKATLNDRTVRGVFKKEEGRNDRLHLHFPAEESIILGRTRALEDNISPKGDLIALKSRGNLMIHDLNTQKSNHVEKLDELDSYGILGWSQEGEELLLGGSRLWKDNEPGTWKVSFEEEDTANILDEKDRAGNWEVKQLSDQPFKWSNNFRYAFNHEEASKMSMNINKQERNHGRLSSPEGRESVNYSIIDVDEERADTDVKRKDTVTSDVYMEDTIISEEGRNNFPAARILQTEKSKHFKLASISSQGKAAMLNISEDRESPTKEGEGISRSEVKSNFEIIDYETGDSYTILEGKFIEPYLTDFSPDGRYLKVRVYKEDKNEPAYLVYDMDKEQKVSTLKNPDLNSSWNEAEGSLLWVQDRSSIMHLDLETNENTMLYEGELLKDVALVDEDTIAFIEDEELFVYNHRNKVKDFVAEGVSRVYSPAKNDKVIYYSSGYTFLKE